MRSQTTVDVCMGSKLLVMTCLLLQTDFQDKLIQSLKIVFDDTFDENCGFYVYSFSIGFQNQQFSTACCLTVLENIFFYTIHKNYTSLEEIASFRNICCIYSDEMLLLYICHIAYG